MSKRLERIAFAVKSKGRDLGSVESDRAWLFEQHQILLAENKNLRSALEIVVELETNEVNPVTNIIAQQALDSVSTPLTQTAKERIADPQIVDVDIDDLEPVDTRPNSPGVKK